MGPKTRILIASGSSRQQRILKCMFNSLGIDDIEFASDSNAALEEWQTHRYDLIVVDISIQPMSGVDLLKHMTTNNFIEGQRFLLVIYETTGKQSLIDAIQAGLGAYIISPFTAQRLQEVLDRIEQRLDELDN